MRSLCVHAVAACIATLAMWGCGKEQPTPGAAQKLMEDKIAPYTYPAPVKGHLKDINIGEFDLVDGIAYPSKAGGGTVVYVTSKPIASPMLVDSACPFTQAQALSTLRKANFSEPRSTLTGDRDTSPPARRSAAALPI